MEAVVGTVVSTVRSSSTYPGTVPFDSTVVHT